MVIISHALCYLICIAAAAAAKSLQSCLTLCDLETAAHQAPPSLGFSRREHWSGLPFPSPMHESEVAQLCPTLCEPMDCSLPGSSVHEIFQARVLEWVAIAFSMKRSLAFPILLFSSISLHPSLKKAFLSLLAILRNSAFKWAYLSFSPLPFVSFLSYL